ncbi:hypothetical protein GOHSU_23_00300 [Gordonia hirsuta DSM 44140 = NBRC 16056]|uniref:Uncharacterized protein n=1 Tax=Gordonia hirsuta DSM 44140 = NBRC 16056 TaxID=1121927 RepID=L7L9T4_9ACTN|nr:hypothetical protein [Gordonia hirsuta]GAC57684.1 hypothetical protein GOHSU_23_00300 [Gordonia hirsuta DSM 44140 = NBRC 16056]
MTKPVRETLWSVLATVVLAARLLATIGAVIFTLMWLVAAVRDSLVNLWLWWALGSVLMLVVSTYLYSVLRVRYPSRSQRWEE